MDLRESTKPRATERFSRQHEELVNLSKELVRALDTRTIAIDPMPVRRALAVFTGQLRVHAAMEQDALYPRLLASHDPKVAEKAQDLLREVGAIYDEFFAFLTRWTDGRTVAANAEDFCRETMQQLYRLRLRMKREAEELYPLVEAHESTAQFDTASRRVSQRQPSSERPVPTKKDTNAA